MASIYNINPTGIIPEGQPGMGSIWRANDLNQAETLTLYYQSVTAQAGIDFDATPQTITFAPGQIEAFYEVRTFDDAQVEYQENLQVFLYRQGASQGGPYAAMTSISIRDNDTPAEVPVPATTRPTFPVSVPTVNPAAAAAAAGVNVNGNTINSGNTVTNNINTTNVTNNYVTDNSTNYNNSFNTDNSVTTVSLSTVTSSNDYSIGKTISGNGRLTGTDANDLITGGKAGDSLYGNVGNDELIGGKGLDSLYGGLGSNVFNAGTSSSRKDADKLYVQREGTAETADIIESIGRSDRIYLQGSTGNVNVQGVDGGLGIFDNGVLQAIYTGTALNASQLGNQLVAS
jgi:hypothetical protein